MCLAKTVAVIFDVLKPNAEVLRAKRERERWERESTHEKPRNALTHLPVSVPASLSACVCVLTAFKFVLITGELHIVAARRAQNS